MYSSKQPDSGFSNRGTEIVQQSSHVMQLPPYKPLRKKIINIDTRFQYSDTGYGSEKGTAVYNIVLPQRITEVQSVEVKTMEVPVSFYNFSCFALPSNFFSNEFSSFFFIFTIKINNKMSFISTEADNMASFKFGNFSA